MLKRIAPEKKAVNKLPEDGLFRPTTRAQKLCVLREFCVKLFAGRKIEEFHAEVAENAEVGALIVLPPDLEHRLQTPGYSFIEWTIFIHIYERREDCYEQLTERRIGRCGGVQIRRRHHIDNFDLYSRVLAARQMLIRLNCARVRRGVSDQTLRRTCDLSRWLPDPFPINNIFNFPAINRV